VTSRGFALFFLSFLLVGCHAPSSPPSTSISSFQTSYFNPQQSAASPPAQLPVYNSSSQLARAPAAADASTPQPAPAEDASQPADASPVQLQAALAPEPADAASKSPSPTPARAKPQRYKASVAAYIKRYAVDANELKQARIGTPFAGSVHGQSGSVVCVELVAGAGRTAYLLKDDAVIDSEYGAPGCRDQHLTPWGDAGT